jgi:hypothetical protein
MEQYTQENFSVAKKMVTDNKSGKMEVNMTVNGLEIRQMVMEL